MLNEALNHHPESAADALSETFCQATSVRPIFAARWWAACLAIPLLMWAALGWFARYMADDYFIAALLSRDGFLTSYRFFYLNWTGRYSTMLLVNLATWAGPLAPQVLPLILLCVWATVSAWAAYQFLPSNVTVARMSLAIALGAWLVFGTLNASLNLAQSLFWQTGSLNYVTPLIFYTGLLGWLARGIAQVKQQQNHSLLYLSGVFICAFIVGGFSESATAMQVTAAGLALFGNSVLRRKQYVAPALSRLIWVFFLGTGLAFLLLVLAPGNSVRRVEMPQPPSLILALWWSLKFLGLFLAKLVYLSPLTCLLWVSLPLTLSLSGAIEFSAEQRAGARRNLWLIPALTFLLTLAAVFPGVWATSVSLPNRAWLIPEFVVVLGAMFGGWALGIFIQQRKWLVPNWKYQIVTTMLVLATSLTATVKTLRLIPLARQDAMVFDQNEKLIRQAHAQGAREVTIQALPDIETHLGARYTEIALAEDAENMCNKQAAFYYGLDKIVAIPVAQK